MKLDVHPRAALCDQKLTLCVSDLPAHGRVKISASMCLPWAETVRFESTAWFTADARGSVDVSRQKPDSGSYDFADSMGLIASMKSPDPRVMEKVGRNICVDRDFLIEIAAESGSERTSISLERRFKDPQVRCERITDEFVGEFYYSGAPDNQTIVWLGGSGSGLGINALVCAPLASHGFNVLSVPFFGEKGLPARLSRVPLEYFDRVFGWLAKHPLTSGREVQILGMSKGAEAALLLASRHPWITRVALWAPHAYCFQGIAFRNESSWTYAGKDLPYIRLKNRWLLGDALRCFLTNKPLGFTPLYQKGLASARNREEARIRVENSHSELLLVTSRDCGMWNTYDGCTEIMETLRQHHYAHAVEQVVYEQAGEPYLVPYVIPIMSSVKLAPRLVFSTGGTLEGNLRAQTGAWEKTIAFFHQAERRELPGPNSEPSGGEG